MRRIANKVETEHALERSFGGCLFCKTGQAKRAVHMGAGVARAACETCIKGLGLKSHDEEPVVDKQLPLFGEKKT